MFVVKIVLLLLGVFFFLMAVGGFIVSYEDFRERNKKGSISEYKMKLLFTSIPFVFSMMFLHTGLTIEV